MPFNRLPFTLRLPRRCRFAVFASLTVVVVVALTAAIFSVPARAQNDGAVVIGSKKFTESYVLGEIAKKRLEDSGVAASHRQGIGATGIVWNALRTGAITAYPEYTGTIGEEILKSKTPLAPDAMRRELAKFGVGMGGDLGFDDTYALVMRRDEAAKLGIKTISDLQNHTDLRVSASNEFLERKDGWKPLAQTYGLTALAPKGIEHGLAYRALVARQIDITDAYSTDAGIAKNDLVVLTDDKKFFPQYRAVFLYRLNAPPRAIAALKTLEGAIDAGRMTRLNADAERTKNYALAAAGFFGKAEEKEAAQNAPSLWSKIAPLLGQHLALTGVSLLAAILVGIPLGVWASRGAWAGRIILTGAGVIQTIPSLALLAVLVSLPGFGIGRQSAILALFLYGLLPIVRNTATGLQDIPQSLRESAQALGLSPFNQLRKIFLPLASRTILAGIKTSAVINVGTATIAALIGAGGLGELIVSGLSLNDNATILQGAIPAALLALLVQGGFDLLDRALIPEGLRLEAANEKGAAAG